jgi:hypothetical protein
MVARTAKLLSLDKPKAFAVTRWEIWTAVRQARRTCRSHPAEVRICWDLDNTLADSGSLIRLGKRLQDAVQEAEPVPNMLRFVEATTAALPGAEHIVLTARLGSMRPDTLTWLRRHAVQPSHGAVFFVPYAEAKPRVWRELARGSRLVIVDDLSRGHEGDQPSVDRDLVEVARATASVYLGLDEISQIAANPKGVEKMVSTVVESLARSRSTEKVGNGRSEPPGGPSLSDRR